MVKVIGLHRVWIRKYVRLVVSAKALPDILRTVETYLRSWPQERVRSLQKVDGGWGPFGENQLPVPVNGIRDLNRIQADVHRQRVALAEAGFPLTEELMELDILLSVCRRRAKSLSGAKIDRIVRRASPLTA